MTARSNDAVRASVLAQMDRANQRVRLMLIAAAMGEGALIAIALLITNWKDPVQRLVFVIGMGTWTMLAIGLVILAAHVSRSLGRVVAALSRD